VRVWLISALLVCLSCSDGGVRSGSLPEAADFLPMAADSAGPPSSLVIDADTLGLGDGEQPRLVLRCEEGRLGAYLVVGTLAEVESGWIGDHPVAVRLDSTPSC
jgi:hypothetical protein